MREKPFVKNKKLMLGILTATRFNKVKAMGTFQVWQMQEREDSGPFPAIFLQVRLKTGTNSETFSLF